jgi:glutamine amidotransferase PdxT
MANTKEGLKYVLGSSLIIAATCTIIMLIVVLCLYRMGYFEYNNENMFKIVLLTAFTFGTTWFIADTIITWKDNVKKEDEGINEFVEAEAKSEIEQKIIKCVKDTAPVKQQINNNIIATEPGFHPEITQSNDIQNILREPMIQHMPEYRYIAKNKIQIPEDIDVYLDRGNF